MRILKVFLVFLILLLFGCKTTPKHNLRAVLLEHDFPSISADSEIKQPIILKSEEGVITKISGDCDFFAILHDKRKNRRLEISGTADVEQKIARIRDTAKNIVDLQIKEVNISDGDRKATLNKEVLADIRQLGWIIPDIEQRTQLNKYGKIFEKITSVITIDKSSKEIKHKLMGETKTEKLEDFAWKGFDETYIESPPIRTGDKMAPFMEKSFKDYLLKIPDDKMDIIDAFFIENEAKGIKKISGLDYLVAKINLILKGKTYIQILDGKQKKINIKVGGYKLYEIPNIFPSKYFLNAYIETENDFAVDLAISFDGVLSTLQ